MDEKYRSRKFILAAISLVVGSVGLFTGEIESGDFYLLVGIILGAYGTANVMEKRQ